MLVILKQKLDAEVLEQLCERIRAMGVTATPFPGATKTVIHVPGDPPKVAAMLRERPEIQEIVTLVTPEEKSEHDDWLWPDVFLRAGVAMVVVLGVLLLLAAYVPAGLGDGVNPFRGPESAKPGWYFLALRQLIAILPSGISFLGYLGTIAATVLLFFWPFIDRKSEQKSGKRLVLTLLGLALVASIALLTVLGLTS